LALLELFREALVSFEQVAPLGDLLVRWTGSDDAEPTAADSDWPDDPPAPDPATPGAG
jgi:segregation and condensation protein A